MFGNKSKTEQQNAEQQNAEQQNAEQQNAEQQNAEQQNNVTVNIDVAKILEENQRLRESVAELTDALKSTSLYPNNLEDIDPIKSIANICGIGGN